MDVVKGVAVFAARIFIVMLMIAWGTLMGGRVVYHCHMVMMGNQVMPDQYANIDQEQNRYEF